MNIIFIFLLFVRGVFRKKIPTTSNVLAYWKEIISSIVVDRVSTEAKWVEYLNYYKIKVLHIVFQSILKYSFLIK